MLRLENISKTFSPGTTRELRVLDNLSLDMPRGEFAVLLGANGSGKSTLLKAIAGELPPDSGDIYLRDQKVTSIPAYERSAFLAYIRQSSEANLPSHMTVLEAFMLALSRQSALSRLLLRREWQSEVSLLLANLKGGLESRVTEQICSLSGGEHQLVAMLIATEMLKRNTTEGVVLLLDEHVAHLDPKSASTVMDLTSRLVAEHGLTTLMVTHNVQIAASYGNRVLVLEEGKVGFDQKYEVGARRSPKDLVDILSRGSHAELSLSNRVEPLPG